jgi:peptidoglycan LD-endopeptidase LytH
MRLLGSALRVAVVAAACAALALPAHAADSLSELDAVTAERQDVETRLDAVTDELEALTAKLTDAEVTRSRLADELAALEDAAQRAEDVLSDHVLRAYRGGDASFEMLLDAAGSEEALERARLLDGLGQRGARQVEAALLARSAFAQRRAQLSALESDLRRDRARVTALRAEVEVAFAEVSAREADLVSRRSRQRTVSRSGQQGTYACPIAPPFHFRDTWGAPRSGGRTHKGVDIYGPMRADVYAITDGTIARHSNSGLGGLGLYLAGDDGNLYYYSHLDSILPGYAPGRRVEAGEHIAANGDSGNARGGPPHIHFEVRPGGGGPINPYPHAAAACF